MIIICGEEISDDEAALLRRMFENDCKKFAGEFYEMERSLKYRVNWDNEYKFANSEWKNFVEATRAMYAARLADPKTSEADKRRMHQAIVLQDMLGKGREKDNRLQLLPNTQQFEGDKYENKKIVEKFGKSPNLRATLLNAIATKH